VELAFAYHRGVHAFRIVGAFAGLVGLAGVVGAWAGCGSSGAGGDAGGGDASLDGAAPSETCTATFRWLQKDAYKSSPGRTSKLWPPHTTTTLDVSCTPLVGGTAQDAGSAYQENHGTTPQATDDAGTWILQEMKRETATGSRASLAALLETYRHCQCDPTTKFLGLDALKDNGVQQLVGKLSDYLNANLVCPAPGTAALVTKLQNGDIAGVLAQLPSCTWAGDAGLAAGLDQAWAAIVAASSEVIAGYHVCNNDAKLQAGLWQGYRTSQSTAACDGDASVCHGPLWLYDP
jgi:hypothetical protein